MAPTLYYHPLSSYCQKVLIALYENDTAFEPHLVELQDEAIRAEYIKTWPIGKFPVLKDGDRLVPESSIIIEYLDLRFPGATRFLPADPELARQVRFHDRFADFYLNDTMIKIVTDRLRPEGSRDAYGVEQARKMLHTALAMLNSRLQSRQWAMGESFSMADCAAAPALFYANRVVPFDSAYPNVAGYLDRLMKRPSFARALREAKPYLEMFPEK